jgi:ABC-type branched-subunit amino acid transport system substrate-binding protein
VEFSPANTSTVFDDAKTDPKNLYFRTAPSDVLQGAVLANQIIEDGKTNIAILARQDAYGEALARETTKGIKAGGGNVVATKLYSADATNFTAEVNGVAAKKPDAIVLISFDEVTKLIPQMIAKGIGPKNQQIYFVDGDTKQFGSTHTFPKGTLDGVKATYPGAELTSDFKPRMLKTDPKLTDFTYGPESYDATMLTVLAAMEAKSDDPTTFAPHIVTVSKDGTQCSSFKDCAALLKKGEDIDYQGVSGPCDMGPTGSPTKATIGIFKYDATNNYKNVKYVTGVI